MKIITFARHAAVYAGLIGGVLAAGAASAASNSSSDSLHFLPIPKVTGSPVKIKSNQQFTIKFGIGLAKESAQYQGVEYFKKIVEQRSGGHIKVNIFPSAQLGGDLQMTSALQSGTLEMTQPSTSPLIKMQPKLAVFDLPFLFSSAKQAHQVLDGPVGQKLLKQLSNQNNGLVALAWAQNGFRQLTDSKGAISKPSQLKGLKIRTMQSPVQLDIWKTLGANPTPMSFAELFTALDQGTVDAQENPWITILTSKFYEVQSNATDTRHVYTPFITLMSQRFYQRLPKPYQKLVKTAAVQAGHYERRAAVNIAHQAKQDLEKKGLKITELTKAQRAAFRKKAMPVYQDFKGQIGEPLFDNVMKATGHTQAIAGNSQ
ncbi:TRAP transporter substrate-binding protein [Salinisphaera sp. RV14]|uniref:TRAP transporter substrate-binding protein n=1 Tax=unclassified Salinisphaera TaxID=2649847 RepID=UPI003F836E94